MSYTIPDSFEMLNDGVRFSGRVKPAFHQKFLSFVRQTIQRKPERVTIDFSSCQKGFPNTMLPIILDVARLRASGILVDVVLPKDGISQDYFRRRNWAHFLDPTKHEPASEASEQHLCAIQFRNEREQFQAVTDLVEAVMRHMRIDRSILAGLEWSLNEVTDNVLNHANAPDGGLVELAIMREKVVFCIADSGRGIRASLREAMPHLVSDVAAIAQAVRAGVTRNKEVGQGNGLSGSLKIATETGGLFHIKSGKGDCSWREAEAWQAYDLVTPFEGTLVDLQIGTNRQIDLSAVLSKGTNLPDYKPTDLIELKYLSDDAREICVVIRDDTFGFGSRRAGSQIRVKCLNLLDAEPGRRLVLNWDGIQMVSSSYADEFVGKLFWELGPLVFSSRVRNEHLLPVIAQLINKAILQRVSQMVEVREQNNES